MATRAGVEGLSRIPLMVAAVFERRVAGLGAEAGRAAGTVQTFALISILPTVAFTLFYGAGTGSASVLPWLNGAAVLGFCLCVLVVRRGHQLAGAVLYLSVATAAMVYMVQLFGWRTGHHLYLITAAQLVFLVFIDRQRLWRWVFVAVSASAFLYSQLLAPAVGPSWTRGELELGRMFAVNAVGTATLMFVLSVVAHHRAAASQLEAAQHAARAEYLANTDMLTGLENRRPITARLEQVASDEGSSYCVAVADLDRFKQLNDTHGHACGDRVLATLGDRLRGELRATDSVGRWGGEEFIFVLADTSLDEATMMMERMRSIVGGSPVECGTHVHGVTMSVGVADGVADRMSHRVVKRADDALYDAKLAGRDCVRVRPLGDEGIRASSNRRAR